MVIIPQETLHWLLEENNPPVRNLTKEYLQNNKPTKTELAQVNNYLPIKTILSLLKPDGTWSDPKNPYKKYTGNYWQFIFLCDLSANRLSEAIQLASENIFSYQLPDGGFPHKIGFKKPLMCLSANILRSLIYFGYQNDERVQKGIDMITQHVLEHQSVVCIDPIYTLLPDCQMSLTKVLAMYSFLDEKYHSSDVQQVMKIIRKRIVENKVFKYVPIGAREYYNAIKGKKTTEIRQIKARMLKQTEKLKKTIVKSSWTRFGFPHSYTSDALETLYWLAKTNSCKCPEIEEAVNLVINRMNPSGYWINENNFRNPMLVDIEAKKSPSKWLTFRACFVLKKFSKLKFKS
ncbi:MAG: hypothetical protein ACFFB5_11580 [Promethearchaeota archaeon]